MVKSMVLSLLEEAQDLTINMDIEIGRVYVNDKLEEINYLIEKAKRGIEKLN